MRFSATAVTMRLTRIVQLHKKLGWGISPYSILPWRIFSRYKARRTGYVRQFKLFKPVIPHLPPECERAIASNIYSPEISRLVDVAIVQAEARYALEFVGVAS